MRFVFFLMLCGAAFAERKVAITIDDLPLGGGGSNCSFEKTRAVNRRLLEAFQRTRTPVTGFANTGRCGFDSQQQLAILGDWLEAGADLGNHTYTHPDLNSVPLDEYLANAAKGEDLLQEALRKKGKQLRYFRHPFLHTGKDAATREGLEK